MLAKDKGVHREVESEGSRRQTLGPTNRNYIQGGVLAANGLLLLLGVVGLLWRGFVIRKIADRYSIRKYELVQGFAQTD